MRHLDRLPSPACCGGALAALVLTILLAVPAAAGASGHAHAARAHVSQWQSDDADGFGWAVLDGKSDCTSETPDGDVRAALAREARNSGVPVLWLRLDGKHWVVRDRALVDRADELLRPMRELGEQMGALGGEMGKLGAAQGRYGAEVGRLAARRAALEVRLATTGLTCGPRLEARERAELRRKCHELEREQQRLERERERVELRGAGTRMEALGRRMEGMGDRMRELGARVEREMRELAGEAIAQRKAARFAAAA